MISGHAPSDMQSVTMVPGSSPLRQDVDRRQIFESAASSTSSYNYWWPYPPGGVYATTTTSVAPMTPTQVADLSDAFIQETTLSEPATSAESTSDSSSSFSSSTTTNSDNVIHITAPTAITSPTTISNPTHHELNIALLAPLFVGVGLVLGLCTAFLLYRFRDRCGRRYDEEHATDALSDEKAGAFHHENRHHSGVFLCWWNRLRGRSLDQTTNPMEAHHDVLHDATTQARGMAGYGYGEWHVGSYRRPPSLHYGSSDEDGEIDLSQGWKTFDRSPLHRTTSDYEDKFTSSEKRLRSRDEAESLDPLGPYLSSRDYSKRTAVRPWRKEVNQVRRTSAGRRKEEMQEQDTVHSVRSSSPAGACPEGDYSVQWLTTPRDESGAVKHKSIRRGLVQRLDESKNGNKVQQEARERAYNRPTDDGVDFVKEESRRGWISYDENEGSSRSNHKHDESRESPNYTNRNGDALKSHMPFADLPATLLSPPLQPHLFFATPGRNGAGKGKIPRELSRHSSQASSLSSAPPPSHFSKRTREKAISRVESIVKRSWSTMDVDDIPKSPTGFGAYEAGAGAGRRDQSQNKGLYSPSEAMLLEQGIEQRLGLLRRYDK
ncbi:hypothetical protein FRC03_003416 [Tulasnella sp. 419]|nr:hypothetical protein FRC03_003416 [Tulasnella sp. 419]